jgi:tRNA A37 threonylcarbamoyltransferase TsaD
MLTLRFPQSGLATKVEKTNRKNRKERKNRQKKVCTLFSCTAFRSLSDHP